MTYNNIASAYREASARGSHPVTLVVKLYDAILQDFRRAALALDSGDVEARTSCLNHALKIIAELQGTLDFDRGGEVAQRLNSFYDVTRPLVIEANAWASAKQIQKLIDLYLPLRQAWRQVEEEVLGIRGTEMQHGAPATRESTVGQTA